MKKKYFKRTIALVLCLMMLLSSTTFASDTDPVLTVMGHNLALLENFSIMYYVDAQNVPANATKGLLIFTKPQAAYTIENAEFNITESTTSYGYDLYYFNDVAAKQITENFYAVPYAMVGDLVYYGEADKYSVLEYCLNKKNSETIGSDGVRKLGEVVSDILQYGTSTQEYLKYNTTRLANEIFYRINIEGGVLTDNFTTGLYCKNETVDVIATFANVPGYSFEGWYDSADNLLSINPVASIDCPTNDETFTAKYSQYSVGIEFESNGDGTCSIVGVGELEGDDLVIPAKAPNGDVVTYIDQSAFSGGTFKTVTIPDTITDIGKRAFDGCANLTDVYFGGTAAKWAEVTIFAFNDSLNNAAFHSLITHVVTFVDWDENLLSVQIVNDGEDAVAPNVPAANSESFVAWNQNFENVVSDLKVVAQYNYIKYGSYPQSEVTDNDLINELTGLAESTSTWTSYGYYIENTVSDYMKYKDVMYNGEKYRGVYFSQYRPYGNGFESTTDRSFQDDNGYSINTIYWFKFDPIKWNILESKDGEALLLNDNIIDIQEYDSTNDNNYAKSSIRNWLNNAFYATAFTLEEQSKIKTTIVDNSSKSTGIENNPFVCDSTKDKIFLLSYEEATKTEFGFGNPAEVNADSMRQKILTPYCLSQGAYNPSENGWWWLRSPFDSDPGERAQYVNSEGNFDNYFVSRPNRGVVAAFRLGLSNDYDDPNPESESQTIIDYGNYSRCEDYVYFGSYPQNEVTNANLKKVLTNAAGSISNWTSYQCYVNSTVSSFMKCKDVTYNGEKYRGVHFTQYRPQYTTWDSSANRTFQDNNKYGLNTIYWFKYEPIKWKILEEKDGDALLVSESILDSTNYKHPADNNYLNSTIRSYINGTFYKTAFNADEQNLIKTTTVDNGALSTGYSNNKYKCENTEDKLFLLSYSEIMNTSYGFENRHFDSNSREKQLTAYSKVRGAYCADNGCGAWWLRSPDDYYKEGACVVLPSGNVSERNVDATCFGVVPALHLTIEAYSKDPGNTDDPTPTPTVTPTVEPTPTAAPTLDYELLSDGTYAIVQYNGSTSKVDIPSSYKDKPVTIIAEDLFKNNTTIEEVVIPSSVREIGANAFSGCTALKSVQIKSTSALIYIGRYAFSGCKALTSIYIPKNVEYIGAYAFYNSGLKTADFASPTNWNLYGIYQGYQAHLHPKDPSNAAKALAGPYTSNNSSDFYKQDWEHSDSFITTYGYDRTL